MSHFVRENLSLDPQKLPQHVAIIMDGNGRWAKSRGLPRVYGHKKGAETAKKIVIKTLELKIPYLTLFAFSKENWERPTDEVHSILELLRLYLVNEKEDIKKRKIRFKAIGDIDDFPGDLKNIIMDLERETKENQNLTLTLALSYGGRAEILKAVREIALKVEKGEIRTEEIDEAIFRKFLYTADLPDPDLLIRTSGELRISNFLLFQLAYTEFYFTSVYWPDFDETEYIKALQSYQKRERRFGKIYDP